MVRSRPGLRSDRGAVAEVERIAAIGELPAVEADASAVTCSGAVPLAGLTDSAAVGPVACCAVTVTLFVAWDVRLLLSVAVTVTV